MYIIDSKEMKDPTIINRRKMQFQFKGIKLKLRILYSRINNFIR